MQTVLQKLSAAFPSSSIEWRVSRAVPWGENVRCWVFPYLTARAIHQRLDDAVGPDNWCNTPQIVSEVKPGILSVQVGISIRINDEWITKYNVSEATGVEPAKGAFSGAEKRAGEEWGIGRQLWYLKEMDAETSKKPPAGKGWIYAKLSKNYGGEVYYWKPPTLPAWALPRIDENEPAVTQAHVEGLKQLWRKKLAPMETNRQVLAAGFSQWVESIVGTFLPIDEPSLWTHQMLTDCNKRIAITKDGNSPSPDVPFE